MAILSSIFRSTTRLINTGCRRMMSSSVAPWLSLPPSPTNGGGMSYKFYDLCQNRVVSLSSDESKNTIISPYNYDDHKTKLVGSSHGWLALFDCLNCHLYLTNPITRRHVQLPPVRNLDGVSKVIISCDDPENEGCIAMMICNTDARLAFCFPGRGPTEWTPLVNKDISDDDVDDGESRHYHAEDIMYSNRHKRFFSVKADFWNNMEMWGWDFVRDPNNAIPRWWEDLGYRDWIEQRTESLESETRKGELVITKRNLVEYGDEMFVVSRHILSVERHKYKTIAFDVHRIDARLDRFGYVEDRSWEDLLYLDELRRMFRVKGVSRVPKLAKYFSLQEGAYLGLSHVEAEEEDGSPSLLDGLSMFVGLNHSFAVPAADVDGLKPDSIYFTDNWDVSVPCWRDDVNFGGHDIGIYDYKNKTISPCYYPCDFPTLERIRPSPLWFTPTPLHT